MRIARLFIALCLLLPAAAGAVDTDANAPAAQYQIELVLFLRDAHPGGEYWPADPGLPDPARAVAALPVPADSTLPPTLITPLSTADYRLTPEADALARKGLTPLLHLAWRQPVGPRDNSDWIWLDGGQVSGLVRIGLGRFLHIDTDLALRNPEGDQPQVIRSIDHRRMRSGELHYLDHPAFGILVRIDPYEPPEPPAPTLSPLPPPETGAQGVPAAVDAPADGKP